MNRIETAHWVSHVALLSMNRYRSLLQDKVAFDAIFPGVDFTNPKITHAVDDHGVLLETSKKELLTEENYNLFKAWQIVLAIIGMSSILECYQKDVIEKQTGRAYNKMGIFDSFPAETSIQVSEFPRFDRLNHYHKLRNISVHRLGKIDEKFRKKTGGLDLLDGPYTYCPQQISEYRELIIEFVRFVELRRV